MKISALVLNKTIFERDREKERERRSKERK